MKIPEEQTVNGTLVLSVSNRISQSRAYCHGATLPLPFSFFDDRQVIKSAVVSEITAAGSVSVLTWPSHNEARRDTTARVLVSSIRPPPRNLRRGILVDRTNVHKREYGLASLPCLDQLRRLSVRFVKSFVSWRKFISPSLQCTSRSLCKGRQFRY